MARPQPTKEVMAYYPIPFTPRPDQVETIDKLCTWERNGCFYPVGGGKTFISTYVAFYWALHDFIDQIIILCPPILVKQWVAWLESFKGTSVCRYAGTKARRAQLRLDADCIVTTPGLFKNDHDRFMTYFRKRRVFMIVDEATVVRQCETLAHKAVREFIDTGQKMLSLLTGTEISAPFQAYGYIKLITPHIYSSYRQFALCHITGVDQYDTPREYRDLEGIKINLLLQAVRKEAREIMDLPGVNYVPIEYELDPKHKKLYDKVVSEQLVELDDGQILDGLIPQRMRMTCQQVLMVPSEFEGVNIQPAGFALIDAMRSELGNEKLMIFANFNSSNEAIYDYCMDKGINAALVYGGPLRSAAKNQADLKRFLEDPACQVLVGNPKSCGIGVDGIQEVCRAALFLELVPFDLFEQAVGRINRSGQNDKCVIWMAIASGTIQVDMKRKALQKEDLAKKVVPTKAHLRDALMGR